MKEKKVQQRHEEEFKRQAVEMVIHSGKTQAQIARELGVSGYSLNLWKKAYLKRMEPAQLGSRQMSPEQAALKNALVLRQPEAGLYFHSDQGSQYSSDAVRKPLTVIGANLSMSAAGNCYENAKAEAFFSTLKGECFPERQVFGTKAGARREIFEYIQTYYNNTRLHSALGYQAPVQYETEFSRVIDSGLELGQSIDAAPEDRALRGRTSSADMALQTAGVTASGRHTKPGRRSCRSKPKAKNPRGFGGQSHPIPSTIH